MLIFTQKKVLILELFLLFSTLLLPFSQTRSTAEQSSIDRPPKHDSRWKGIKKNLKSSCKVVAFSLGISMVVLPFFNADSDIRSLLSKPLERLNIISNEPPLPSEAENALKEAERLKKEKEQLEEALRREKESPNFWSNSMITALLMLLAVVLIVALCHYMKYGHLYLGRLFVSVVDFPEMAGSLADYQFFPMEDPSTLTVSPSFAPGQEGAWLEGQFPGQQNPTEQTNLAEEPTRKKKKKKRKKSHSSQQPQYHYAPLGAS